jgi:hypothetical protein
LVLADWIFDDPLQADNDGPQVTFKPGGGFKDGGNTMVIKNTDEYCAGNPCDTVKIHFQVCTHGFGCHPKLITAACPCMDNMPHMERFDKDYPDYPRNNNPMHPGMTNPVADYVAPDACCGSKPYHSGEKICCHDQLYDMEHSNEIMCCGTHKYEKYYQKCCMSMGGVYGQDTNWSIIGAEDVCQAFY